MVLWLSKVLFAWFAKCMALNQDGMSMVQSIHVVAWWQRPTPKSRKVLNFGVKVMNGWNLCCHVTGIDKGTCRYFWATLKGQMLVICWSDGWKIRRSENGHINRRMIWKKQQSLETTLCRSSEISNPCKRSSKTYCTVTIFPHFFGLGVFLLCP